MIPLHENKMKSFSWPLNGIMPMHDDEYGLWIALLKQRVGITISEQRKSFLLSKLSIRMQELSITEYNDYFSLVTKGTSGLIEWETLVDRLTVHETRFFRDPHALSFLIKNYFSTLSFKNTTPNVHIWSVGCSTGEEPYSLLMHIDHYLKQNNKKCYLALTASDVSHKALDVGKKAVYNKSRFNNVATEYIENYLNDIDEHNYQIKKHIRQRVCFNLFNLMNIEQSSVGKVEIIICQNVLIYFDREMRVIILNKLVEHLIPGGLLVLAPGEISNWEHAAMIPMQHDGVLAFQRKVTCDDLVMDESVSIDAEQKDWC